MKRPLVILTGPTAVGKTNASIGLAKKIGGAIIILMGILLLLGQLNSLSSIFS